ncbi:mucin-5AC [Oryzias melastigma]|uniref:DNA/RNA non-specific endonuclease domain-containing protein n=1 Tax=Oryzias melastigma TaxID=30732 RepID=A0A3B3BS80_ORYME|nr:mucin-5AC [Oryzias melastigma]
MLLFLLLVFLPAVPIETEVVETLADCPGFFVEETPPEIPNILVGGNIRDQNRYKVICQTFGNKRRFLTLYDTKNKIPVFSAYRFTGAPEGIMEDNLWKIEPQLDDDKNLRKLEDYNQALDNDYDNNLGYNRGHLYPNFHAPDPDAQLSTFTLTNAVPQLEAFNHGSWANMEECTKCYMENNCINANGEIEAFVVTGAEPGEKKLNDKINIPSRMWSAFCCYNSRDGVWLSKAYWGHNVHDTCPNLEERSCDDIKDTFGIQIFPKRLCSFKKPKTKQRSKRSTFCRRSECECLLENSTTTAPPTTTDKTSEKTTFPPRTTPTTVTTPQTTTTLMTTTKTTKPTTTSTTKSTKSTTKKQKKDKKENKNRNTGNKGGGQGGGGGGLGNFLKIFGISSAVLGGITSGIVSAMTPVASGIGGVVGPVAGGIGSVVGPVAGGIGSVVGPVADGIGSVVGPVADEIGSVVGPVADEIGSVVGPVADGIGSVVGPVAGGIVSGIIPLFGGFFGGGGGDRERTYSIINYKSTDPPSKTVKTVLTTPQTSITVPTNNLKTTSTTSATQTTNDDITGNEFSKETGESPSSLFTPTTIEFASPDQTPDSATLGKTVLTTPERITVTTTNQKITTTTSETQTTKGDSKGNASSTSLPTLPTIKLTSFPSEIHDSTTCRKTVWTTPQTPITEPTKHKNPTSITKITEEVSTENDSTTSHLTPTTIKFASPNQTPVSATVRTTVKTTPQTPATVPATNEKTVSSTSVTETTDGDSTGNEYSTSFLTQTTNKLSSPNQTPVSATVKTTVVTKPQTPITVPTTNEKSTSVTQTTDADNTGNKYSTSFLTPPTIKFASPNQTPVSATVRTTVLVTPKSPITVPATNENTVSSTSVTQTTDGDSTGNEYGKVTDKSSTPLLTPTTTNFASPNQTPVSAIVKTTVLTKPQTPITVPTANEKSTSTDADSTGNEYSTSFLTPPTIKFASPNQTPVSATVRTTVKKTPQTPVTVPATNENTVSSTSVTQTTDGDSTGNEYGKVTEVSSTPRLTPTTNNFASPNKIPVSGTIRTIILTKPQTPITVPTTNEKSTSVTQTTDDDSRGDADLKGTRE